MAIRTCFDCFVKVGVNFLCVLREILLGIKNKKVKSKREKVKNGENSASYLVD